MAGVVLGSAGIREGNLGHLQKKMLGSSFLPPQRGGNWRSFQMRDVHLRGKVLGCWQWVEIREHIGWIDERIEVQCFLAEMHLVLYPIKCFLFNGRLIHCHN